MNTAEALARTLAAVHDDLGRVLYSERITAQPLADIRRVIREALDEYGVHGGQS